MVAPAAMDRPGAWTEPLEVPTMTDPTSHPAWHETLRAYMDRGGSPAEHPAAHLLVEVAGADRWLARTFYREEAARRVAAGPDDPLHGWTVELLDDDELADRFLDGLPDEMVRSEERSTMEMWDRQHRPWALKLVVIREGYHCAISGRTDSLIALELTPRLEEGDDPILLHPDEVLGVHARGLQILEEGVALTIEMGPLRRRRMIDDRLAEEGHSRWASGDHTAEAP